MATSSTDLKTIGTINREFFDKYAGFVSNEGWIRDLHEQIRDVLKQNINKIASPQEGLKMLDYACGNGIISTTLAPFASIIRGIDISESMVDQYNLAAKRIGLSSSQMRAVRGDLLWESEALQYPDLFEFDIVVVSVALHHVEHPGNLIHKLADRLKSGGSLLVIDSTTHSPPPEQSAHHASHTIARHGFGKEELRDMFTAAGLSEFYLGTASEKIPCSRRRRTSGFLRSGEASGLKVVGTLVREYVDSRILDSLLWRRRVNDIALSHSPSIRP